MTCKFKVTNEGPEPHRVAVEVVDATHLAEQKVTEVVILAVGESHEVTIWDTREIRVSESA